MALRRALTSCAPHLTRGYASYVSSARRASRPRRVSSSRAFDRTDDALARLTSTTARARIARLASRSISLTVVRDGVRHDVRGQVGETLANALARDAALASAVPVVSIDRGPDAHVYIPDEFLAKMPPLDADDVDKLEDVAIDMGKNSRLASQVTLSSELDGLVAAVGRAYAENPM
jgi:hypothetical protein